MRRKIIRRYDSMKKKINFPNDFRMKFGREKKKNKKIYKFVTVLSFRSCIQSANRKFLAPDPRPTPSPHLPWAG